MTRAIEGDTSVVDVEARVNEIQGFLNRARVQLEQARSALADGHSDVRRWHRWEQLRRGCDDLQLELIDVLLNHTGRVLSGLEGSRSINDPHTLKHIDTLLGQAHTALSISPPSSRVWDKWQGHHALWTRLERRRKVLSNGFVPAT